MRDKEKKAIYDKKYRQDHKEEKAAWCQKNREKIAITTKVYYQKNKEEIALQKKKHQQKNKEKISAYGKKYYQKNKKRIAIRDKKYYQNHKKEAAIYNKKYYQEHKEERITYTKKYHQEHPEIQRKNDNKRRLKKLQLLYSYTPEQWKDKVDATKGICPQCKRPYEDTHPFCCTLDHKPSVSIAPPGFCYTIDNVSPVCGSCNARNYVHGDGCLSLDNFIGGIS